MGVAICSRSGELLTVHVVWAHDAAGRRAGRAAAYGEYEEGAGLEDEEDDYALEEEEEMEVDAVDLYCSRSLGRLAVTLASGVVGTLIGSAISAVSDRRHRLVRKLWADAAAGRD